MLVSSYSVGGTGTYGFTANGLSDEIRECLPKISGTNFVFNEVGGNTNANASFILYSTTNVATPLGLWIPVLTNQFDQFGVFGYTNGYNPALKQQYFRCLLYTSRESNGHPGQPGGGDRRGAGRRKRTGANF